MKKPERRPAPRQPAGASHHPHMRHANRAAPNGIESLFEVRRSGIHGRGVYAARPIPKGTRIVEYLGERITHKQADDRYAAKGQDDGHTFLFVVNSRIVIDAGVDGNDARYINHSCDPNCDTVIEGGRVYIESLRDIETGEELGYEYGLTWETTDDPDELANYACRCGAKACRGTMLAEEPVDAAKRARAKRRGKKKAGAGGGRKAKNGRAGRRAREDRAVRRGKTRR
ncbi:MAG: SET domain-containing protein-lysine N-methyltransferase [Steroidobacteraceae bacterium]